MRIINRILVASAMVGAVNLVYAEINDGLGQFVKPTPSPHNRAGTPATSPPAMQKAPSAAPVPAPAGPISEGKVVDKVDGAGYTYLQLDQKGQRIWIAGTQVKASKGDKVRFQENVVMENFHSKTLNRTFDKIIFASSVTVLK